MIQNLYAIRDRKANSYLRPFTSHNHAVAIRSFFDCIQQDPKHQFAIHSDDFALWHLGLFDDSTGKISTADVQQELAIASQALNTIKE